jgi:mediator of RNA polymerase II transcription subunit 14
MQVQVLATMMSQEEGNLPEYTGTLDAVRTNGVHEHPEDLERELPVVFNGQVPLGDLLSRVVQSIYAELSELAET